MRRRKKRARPEGWVPFSQWKRTERAKEYGVEEAFTPAMKARVKKQFNNRCFLCPATRKLHIDHHLPLSAGHALDYGNAVLLCCSHNAKKGTKMPEDFYTPEQLRILSQMLAVQRMWKG